MKRALSTVLALLLGVAMTTLGAGVADAAPSNGVRDVTFAPTGVNQLVWASAVDSHDRVVVAGMFTSAEGVTRGRIARYLADGTLDTAFATGPGFNGSVNSLTIDSGDNVIAGGGFTTYDGTTAKGIARLTATTGALDTTFATGAGFNGSAFALAIDAGGNIVAGGDFTTYQGTTAGKIARLTPTGALDTSFATQNGFNNGVYGLAIDPGGNVVVAGAYSYFNSTPVPNIARLTPTGALDTSFTTGTGFDNGPRSVAIDASGGIVVGGYFTTYNGATANRIVRLTPTGALDTTFATGTGFNNIVFAVAIDRSGNVVVGGSFTAYQGSTANRIARLTPTGAPDTSFATGTGLNNTVYGVAIDRSDAVVAGGTFTTYQGTTTNRISRLIDGVFLSYDAGGGTGTAPATQTVARGGTVTVAAGTGLTRAGYTFTGWNTAANGSGTALAAGGTRTISADVTAYAQWTITPVSLSYDAGGGTGTAPATQNTPPGGTVTVAAATGLTRAGYAFAGWNTAADGSGTAVAVGAGYTLTANRTLYAQWTLAPVVTTPTPGPTPGSASATITLLGGTGSIAGKAPVAVTATGLRPGSTWTLTMHSAPVVLATGSAPASGAVQTSTTLPATVPTGAHRLVLVATAADGTPQTVETSFSVDTEGRITTGTLAATGNVDAIPLTALGALLLLTGTGALIATRRRQH